MTAFDAALAVLAADPNLGTDATYRAAGTGAPVLLRVLRSSPDRVADGFGTGILQATDILTVPLGMSIRETAITALQSRLVLSLALRNPAPKLLRNGTVPQRLPPGGLVVLRDRETVEETAILSTLAWQIEHRAVVEAKRDRRAKVISAEGEYQAAQKLLDAAEILARRPEAMQRRYLSTLALIDAQNSSVIVFPFPQELLQLLRQRANVPKPRL